MNSSIVAECEEDGVADQLKLKLLLNSQGHVTAAAEQPNFGQGSTTPPLRASLRVSPQSSTSFF